MTDLIRMYYAPAEVFERVRDGKAGWVLPFCAVLLIVLVFTPLLFQLVGMDHMVRNQLESNPKVTAALSQAQIDQMVERQSSPGYKAFAVILGLVSAGIGMAFVAGILFALIRLTEDRGEAAGPKIPYTRPLAVVGYTWFTTSLVGTAMALLVILLSPDRHAVDVQRLSMLNPGFFLDNDTNRAVRSIATSLDLISITNILLLSLGLSKIAFNLPFGKSFAILGGLWLFWVFLKAGLAFALGGLFG